MSSSDLTNKVETSPRADGLVNVWAWIVDPIIKDQTEPLDPKYKRWVLVGVIKSGQDPKTVFGK